MEASFGLGEALVSGRVNPDIYKVRDGEIIAKADRHQADRHPRLAVRRDAGRCDRPGAPGPAGADGCAGRAAGTAGTAIEAHFGQPQDIEWCLVDDGFQIVQSRPITTLFPIPDSRRPGEPRLHLRRSWADDDRRHEAPWDFLLAVDDPPADVRGRWEVVRGCRPGPGVAGEQPASST